MRFLEIVESNYLVVSECGPAVCSEAKLKLFIHFLELIVELVIAFALLEFSDSCNLMAAGEQN